MSVYARRLRMTDTATFWSLSGDSYYGGGWSVPTTIACNYREGGTMTRDNEGNEFSPSSTYRFFGNPNIKVGDKIIQGTSASADPTDNSETVRKIVTKTVLRGQAAYDVMTG